MSTISSIPQYTYSLPSREQTPAVFDVSADAWVEWFTATTPRINEFIDAVNNVLPGVAVMAPINVWTDNVLGRLDSFDRQDRLLRFRGYRSFVLHPNGRLYGIPYSASHIMVVDTETKTVSFSDMGCDFTSVSEGWVAAALGGDGKIYAPPYGAGVGILIIDPATGTATRSSMGAVFDGAGLYAGCCTGQDGKIYCPPYMDSKVLVIDPATGTATRSSMGVESMSGVQKWSCIALGVDGKLYCPPEFDSGILIIDPTTNTATRSSMGVGSMSGTGKWKCIAAGADGKIYCPPADAADFLIINPATGTATRSVIGSTPLERYHSAALGVDGKLYCLPSSSSLGKILVVNTVLGVSSYGPTLPAGSYYDLTRAFNGDLYAAPNLNTAGIFSLDFSSISYSFPDVVVGSDGYTYRCRGTGVVGVDPVGASVEDWMLVGQPKYATTEEAAEGSSVGVSIDPAGLTSFFSERIATASQAIEKTTTEKFLTPGVLSSVLPFRHMEVKTSSGSMSWPVGADFVLAVCIGAGGGGGYTSQYVGAAGGSGQLVFGMIPRHVTSTTLYWEVGSRGTPQTSSAPGTAGGHSVAGWSNGHCIRALGGQAAVGRTGGAGGVGSNHQGSGQTWPVFAMSGARGWDAENSSTAVRVFGPGAWSDVLLLGEGGFGQGGNGSAGSGTTGAGFSGSGAVVFVW